MRYAVFSDVHGNLEAFQTVVKHYQKEHIDKFVFLGDIVGYGANPNECVSLLRGLKALCVAGNHDWVVIDKFDISYFNAAARQAAIWTKENLQGEAGNYLERFNLLIEEGECVFVHGSLYNPHKFYYILDERDAALNFSLLKKKICFVGHSHVAGIFVFQDNTVQYRYPQRLKLDSGAQYIVNVGSAGQPRDGDARACLCVFDTEENEISFVRLEYNIAQAAQKIVEAGLPLSLARRLSVGW